MDQRTEEWLIARCGSLGASTIKDAIKRLKRNSSTGAKAGEWDKGSFDFMYELAAERLTGVPAKRVDPIRWGNEHEGEARESYAFVTNAEILEVGLIPHPTIPHAHASPDGLVGDDGGLEIKCPTSATHLKTLLDDKIPEEHLPQILWNLACARERQWWDFVSYDPRFPSELQFFLKRVDRDNAAIAKLEAEATSWLAELDGKLKTLRERYPAPA